MREEDYHKSRVMFAVMNDEHILISKNNPRGHKEWLKEDHAVTDEEFEKIIRGNIKDGCITFYKGSNFEPVNNDAKILEISNIIDPEKQLKVFDGVIKGEIGTEWKSNKLIKRD